MSNDQRKLARADYARLAGEPQQLAHQLAAHASEPFYLAEIVDLAGSRWHQLEAGAHGEHDVFQRASDAHGEIQWARDTFAAQHGSTGSLAGALEQTWGKVAGEALVAEIMNRAPHTLHDIATLYDPSNRSLLGIQLGRAVHDGLVGPASVIAEPGTLWSSAAPATERYHATIGQEAAAGAATDVTHLQGELAAAEADLAALDRELAAELVGDQLQVTMTPVKAMEFIATFRARKDYHDADQRVRIASAALGAVVKRDQADLLAFAANKADPVAAATPAGQLMDSYRALASAPGNSHFLAALADRPPAPIAAHHTELLELSSRAHELDTLDAIHELQRIYQATQRSGGDGFGAVLVAAKATLVAPFDMYKQFSDLAHLGKGIDSAYHKWRELAKAPATSRKAAIIEIIHALDVGGDRTTTRIGKTLGTLLGAATEINEFGGGGRIEILAANLLMRSRDFLAIVKDEGAAAHGEGAAHGGAAHGGAPGDAHAAAPHDAAPHAPAAAHAEADLARHGEDVANEARKLDAVPLLGLAFNADQFGIDLAKAIELHDTADIVATVGDAIAVFGNALMFTEVLAPVGGAIAVIGEAISFFAHVFRGDPEGDARRRREAQTATAIDAYGADTPELAALFTTPSARDALAAIAADGHAWTPLEVQTLARAQPWLFTDGARVVAAAHARAYYADPRRGGLQVDTLFAMLTTARDYTRLRLALQVAEHSSFLFVPRPEDRDIAYAVYDLLEPCFSWSNPKPVLW